MDVWSETKCKVSPMSRLIPILQLVPNRDTRLVVLEKTLFYINMIKLIIIRVTHVMYELRYNNSQRPLANLVAKK